jgi:hypothetical protein
MIPFPRSKATCVDRRIRFLSALKGKAYHAAIFIRAEVLRIEVMKGGVTNLSELIVTLREK